jgi:hypothetical protein
LKASSEKHYATPIPVNTIISLIIWFICVLYASIRTSSRTALGKIGGVSEGSDQGQGIPLSCISLEEDFNETF